MTIERISRDHALERIRHHIREHGPRMLEVPLMDALGLVCAQDLFAAHSTPAETRSTVDGYALSSQATKSATEETPALFTVSGQIRPSTAAPAPLEPGQAAGILTGGPLPAGTDCVVTAESVHVEDGRLALTRPLSPQEHVRPVGGDLKAGTRIVRRGDDLTPSVLAALAVSGAQRAKAYMPPRVLALALGNELDDLDAPPLPGHTPADNLLLVAGLLRRRDMPHVAAGVCANDLEVIGGQLAAQDYQCIVTTGGTGPGQRDFIMQAATSAGFTPLFGGLCVTPGKSMFAAVRGSTLLFALPGTPWAVFALMHALVLPAVCWLRGRTLPVPGPILARPQIVPPAAQLGWERLVPCTVSALGAELQAQPLLDRTREARLDMLQAQGLLIISDKAEAGELLPMIPIWESRRGHRLD
ncbi:MAG: molybdopterin molybdotransferase MoeA [Desulfovibrio sp.]|nr:molybdopterin molybdotransferase MoeA [Desulfovibrio sp.]